MTRFVAAVISVLALSAAFAPSAGATGSASSSRASIAQSYRTILIEDHLMADALKVAEKAVGGLKFAANAACLLGRSSTCTHSRNLLHSAEAAIRTATVVVDRAAHVAEEAKGEAAAISRDKKLSVAALSKSAARFSAMRATVVSDAKNVKSTLGVAR